MSAVCYGLAGRHQHAFLMADQTAGSKGVVVLHGNDLVIDGGVQHVRYEACADALNLMCTGSALAQHRGGGGLYGHHLDIGILALEVLAYAGHGAAGANACHKDIDLTIGILPDLGAGGLDVCLGVGRVHELAGDEGTCETQRSPDTRSLPTWQLTSTPC